MDETSITPQDIKKSFTTQKFTSRQSITTLALLIRRINYNDIILSENDKNEIFLSILRGFSRNDSYLKKVLYASIPYFTGFKNSNSFMGVSVLLKELDKDNDPAVLRSLFRIVPVEMVSDLEKVFVYSLRGSSKKSKNNIKDKYCYEDSLTTLLVILQDLINDKTNQSILLPLILKWSKEIEFSFSTNFQTFISLRFYSDLHKNDTHILKRFLCTPNNKHGKNSSMGNKSNTNFNTTINPILTTTAGITVRGLLCILKKIFIKEKNFCINEIKELFIKSMNSNDPIALLELSKFVTRNYPDQDLFIDQLVAALKTLLRNKRVIVKISALNVISRMVNVGINEYYQYSKGTIYDHNINDHNINDYSTNSNCKNLAKLNPELENLTQSKNKSIALTSIEILLKTGTKKTVEKLTDQIPIQLQNFSEPFKITFIDTLEKLCSNYNSKQLEFTDLLKRCLDEQGSLKFKAQVVRICDRALKRDSVEWNNEDLKNHEDYYNEDCKEYNNTNDDNNNSMFNNFQNNNFKNNNSKNNNFKESILNNLCDYIEDSQYPELTMLILKVIGGNITSVNNPQKYLTFIFNRLILENYKVQSAALLSLHAIASQDILKDKIIKIFKKSIFNSQDLNLKNLSKFLLQKINYSIQRRSVKRVKQEAIKDELKRELVKVVDFNLYEGDLILKVKKIIRIRKDDLQKNFMKYYKRDDLKDNKKKDGLKDFKKNDLKDDNSDLQEDDRKNNYIDISFEFTFENTISLPLQNIEISLCCDEFEKEFILKIDNLNSGDAKSGLLRIEKEDEIENENEIKKEDEYKNNIQEGSYNIQESSYNIKEGSSNNKEDNNNIKEDEIIIDDIKDNKSINEGGIKIENDKSIIKYNFNYNDFINHDLILLPFLKYEIIDDNEIEIEKFELDPIRITIFDFIYPEKIRHPLKFKKVLNFKTNLDIKEVREKILKLLNLKVVKDYKNNYKNDYTKDFKNENGNKDELKNENNYDDLILIGSNDLFSIAISVQMKKKKKVHVCVTIEGSDENVVKEVSRVIVQ